MCLADPSTDQRPSQFKQMAIFSPPARQTDLLPADNISHIDIHALFNNNTPLNYSLVSFDKY